MLKLRDDQGRRCPTCNVLIPPNGECARCLGKPGAVDRSKQTDPHMQSVVETLKCFLRPDSDEEVEALKAQIIEYVESLMPEFLKRVTLEALLPLIQQRAQAFFLANDPYCDAEDFAATLVLKILKDIDEEYPHGNVGAWVARIRTNQLLDHWKKKGIERRWFGNREDPGALANVPEADSDDPSHQLFLKELSAVRHGIVEELRNGKTWQEIAARYEATPDDLRKTLLSMEWDGQSVPLRKKRRRRRPQ
jgi:DNA-directed RNA polymerase specialized sigma24 family protein